MKRPIRNLGLAVLGLALFSSQSSQVLAGMVAFDFTSGTVTFQGTTGQTPFTQSLPDGPNTLTGNFTNTFGPQFNVSTGTLQQPTGMTSSGANFAATFNSELDYISFTYSVSAPTNAPQFFGISLYNNNVALSTMGSSISTVTSSAIPTTTFTFGDPTGTNTNSSILFNTVKINLGSFGGTAGAVTLGTFDVFAVPEIDPASATSALAMLGCGVVLLNGRFRKKFSV